MAQLRKSSRPVRPLRLEALEARLNPQGIPILDQVSHFYQVALDRAPDPQGLAYYSSQVEYGAAPESVARQILNSTEHNQKIVTGYYADILGRLPDGAGLASHVAALSRGVGEERLVASILASPEKSGGLGIPAYVNLLYSYILGRSPDQGGETFWVQTLQSGASRYAVAMAFLQCREATNLSVDGLYQSILGRRPTESEKQGWINYLRHPDVTYADAAAVFLASNEAFGYLAGEASPLLTVAAPNPRFWQKTIGLGQFEAAPAPAATPTLNPIVQLSHFGQDIAFTETQTGITSIPINNPGAGYPTGPQPSIITIASPSSGGGTAAKATAIVSNGVVSLSGLKIGNNNTGAYKNSTPFVTITDTNASPGSGAVITLHVNGDGNVDYINNFSGGTGYHLATTTIKVTGALNAQGQPDSSLDATITITSTGIVDGAISAIEVTNPGRGYAPGESVQITVQSPPANGVPATLGHNDSVTASLYEGPSQSKFQEWAKDYLSFVANTGVTTCFINVGDYKADTKGLYNYLRPEYGTNGIPWIVTDFLEPLARLQNPDGTPANVQVGAIAYLKDAWHLYEDADNPNFDGNLLISDGKPSRTEGSGTVFSPPKNNMYQALQLVNEINSYASTKFITHFEFDGEGGGAFVQDDPSKGQPSFYGFNTEVSTTAQPPGNSWSYQPAPVSSGGEPQPGISSGWPTTGPGYTKWLWNHLMPGVAESNLAPGGLMPGSRSGSSPSVIPNVVFTDTQALDPATWSENGAKPYQFGSISYSQPAWFPSSPGPVQSYSENYWWGENNYMPGAPSAIQPPNTDQNGAFYIPVNDNTVFDLKSPAPVVTFNTPIIHRADGTTITGTPAAGIPVLSTGSISISQAQSSNFFTENGQGGGFSTGIWVTKLPTQKGYNNNDVITFPNDPINGGTRPARGILSVDKNSGLLTGVNVTDPGEGWTTPPTSYLINGKQDNQTGEALATFQALLRPEDGYPVLTFSTPTGEQPRVAKGFLTVTQQGYRPGKINGITILDPGSGYSEDAIGSLNGPGTNKVVISQLPENLLSKEFLDIRSQYATSPNSGSTTYSTAGLVDLGGGQVGFFAPVPIGAGMVDRVVVTRLGDHYSAESPPSFTIKQGEITTKALPASLNTTTYNKAYAPIFDLSGAFIINGNGQSLVNVVDGGSGYSAGAILGPDTLAGKGSTYDVAPVVVFTPASGDSGSGAKAFVTLDSKNNIATIQVYDPGTGYSVEPTISFQRAPGDSQTSSPIDTATAYIRNFPRINLSSGTQLPTRSAVPYAAMSAVTPGDYQNGYSIGSIQFLDPGAGYIPANGVPTAAMLPTMTISAPPLNSAGQPAIVDSQFAIVNKWNAFWVDGTGSISSQVGPASSATRESVGSVSVNSPGSGYGWDAQVTFDDPPAGGETAVGYVVLNSDGSINRIAITNPGSGYKSAPTARISSPSNTGQGAFLSVNKMVPKIRGGGNVYNYEIWDGNPTDQVNSIGFTPVQSQDDNNHTTGAVVYQNGIGYKANDEVIIVRNSNDLPPGPNQPAFMDAKATVGTVDSMGRILTFNISQKGTGYQATPTATVNSATGTGAVPQPSLQNLILSVNSADAVYAHYAAYPQSLAQMFNDPKYTTEPSLKKLSDRSYQQLNLNQDYTQVTSNLPGNGISQGAIATFSLESVLLSNTGPAAVANGAGGGATASATQAGGKISSITLTNPGAKYLVPPLVQITDSNGTGASATATLAADGTVSGITITAGGSGYTSPTVTLISQGACLDAKYHEPSELIGVNALGGTFGGLSMLTYDDFITFLNTAADIVVGSQKTSGINLLSTDYSVNGATLTSAVADFQNIRKGMTVEGIGVPAGTVVTANPLPSGNSFSVTLSNPVTGSPALTFYNPISASDVTFSIYDSAFLPLSWLDGQVTNGWKEPNTAPKFSGLLTAGTVAPGALAGTVIHTEVATDNDLLAINRRITYDLKRGLADDARLLRINPATGQVMLRYDASHFPRQSYNFTVVATDGGGLSVEKTIRVRVGGN